MMSVGGISSLVMSHLSLAHDEQMGNMLQNNQQGGMGRISQSAGSGNIPTQGLQVTQIASPNASAVVPNLNLQSVERSKLWASSSQFGAGLFDGTARRVTERRREQGQESDRGKAGKEQIARIMEDDAIGIVVQIAFMIQQRNMFNNYLVADMYQDAPSDSGSASRKLIVVANMDAESQQIPLHASMLVLDASGKSIARRQPGQLVWGQRSFAADWVVMHLAKEPASGIWRLHAEGLNEQLTGVALASGDIPAFAGNSIDVSLHLPGAARYWVTL